MGTDTQRNQGRKADRKAVFYQAKGTRRRTGCRFRSNSVVIAGCNRIGFFVSVGRWGYGNERKSHLRRDKT